MAALPEGSVVVCMGGTVKLVTQREWIIAKHLKKGALLRGRVLLRAARMFEATEMRSRFEIRVGSGTASSLGSAAIYVPLGKNMP